MQLDIRHAANSIWIMKLTLAFSLVLALGLQCAFSATSTGAQPSSKPVPQAKADTAVKKQRPIPFHGTIAAVNPTARTITVGKRIFVLTTETKFYKESKDTPGTIKDAMVGSRVTGSYIKSSEGKLLARSVYFKGAVAATASETGKKTSPDRK